MLVCDNCGISLGIKHDPAYDCSEMTQIRYGKDVVRSIWSRPPDEPVVKGWKRIKLKTKKLDLAA